MTLLDVLAAGAEGHLVVLGLWAVAICLCLIRAALGAGDLVTLALDVLERFRGRW